MCTITDTMRCMHKTRGRHAGGQPHVVLGTLDAVLRMHAGVAFSHFRSTLTVALHYMYPTTFQLSQAVILPTRPNYPPFKY